jgi:hypothetical protein
MVNNGYFSQPERDAHIVASGSFDVGAKVPEIKLLADALEKEIYRLADEVKGLSARLAPVLHPEVATKIAAMNGDTNAPHSEFYNHLDGMRQRLVDINISLSDIKQRLEV